MTVKELIEELEKVSPMDVILASIAPDANVEIDGVTEGEGNLQGISFLDLLV